MDHIFKVAMDVAYRAMGDTVTYIPVTGAQKSINAFPILQDVDVDYGESSLLTPSKIFEVRAEDVSNPKVGDRLVFKNVTYEVIATPEYKDDRQIIWILGVIKK